MPVMVLYQTRPFPEEVLEDIAHSLASLTNKQLSSKIELRAVQTTYSFNANEIHIEMRFRDFGEWSDKLMADYHAAVMKELGNIFNKHAIECAYSFYIVPSAPPRSIWGQANTSREAS